VLATDHDLLPELQQFTGDDDLVRDLAGNAISGEDMYSVSKTSPSRPSGTLLVRGRSSIEP